MEEGDMGIQDSCDADSCVHEVEAKTVPEYTTKVMGIPLVLVDSVQEKTCKHCGEVFRSVLYPERLMSAAAVSRVKLSAKLTAVEIKFLRKALDRSAKELAEVLVVSPETISRWENGKLVMGPTHEKLLRILVGVQLGPKARAIEFDPNEIVNMSIQSVRDLNAKENAMTFRLMWFKLGGEKPAEEYTEQRLVA